MWGAKHPTYTSNSDIFYLWLSSYENRKPRSSVQDEGALVVPPAFAALLGGLILALTLPSGPLTMGWTHPCEDEPAPVGATRLDFTAACPAGSHLPPAL